MLTGNNWSAELSPTCLDSESNPVQDTQEHRISDLDPLQAKETLIESNVNAIHKESVFLKPWAMEDVVEEKRPSREKP